MGVLILTALLVLVILAVLMFSRGGAKEPATASGPTPSAFVPAHRDDDLGAVTERLVERMGMKIERREPDEGRGPGYVASMRDPFGTSRAYVRVYKLPPGERVRSQDVQAAILSARDEGMTKTILIAPNGFSDEAILAAEDTATDLIDGPKLEALLAQS